MKKNLQKHHKVVKSDAEQKDKITYLMATEKKLKKKSKKKNLIEGVLDTLRKIVKEKQAQQVKFSNGKKMTVDMQTANMIVNSIDKRITKPELKKKVEMMLDKDPNGFMKVLDIMNKN